MAAKRAEESSQQSSQPSPWLATTDSFASAGDTGTITIVAPDNCVLAENLPFFMFELGLHVLAGFGSDHSLHCESQWV